MTPTRRLTYLLQNALIDLLPAGAQVEEPTIQVARGYWSHKHQDVMPWQAGVNVRLPGDSRLTYFSCGSWDTVTACVRRGFELVDARHEARAEVHFEAHAKDKT